MIGKTLICLLCFPSHCIAVDTTNPPHHNNSTQETGLHEQTTLPHPTMSWQHRSTSAQSVFFFVAAVLSQGLRVGCTPFTVVAIPGEYGVTTKGENASDVAFMFTNNGSSFVPQGEFRSGFAQQCASGVTDTLLFCVGENESDVYSLTVYDTAQPAFVVLVHDAPRYFDVGAGSGGKVFTAYQPGVLTVVVGTVLHVVDVTSPEDPNMTLDVHLNVSQIMGVKCSGEHIAVHAVESDGVQENVYVYRFVDSILKNIGETPLNGPDFYSGRTSWDMKGGVFAAVYPSASESFYYLATVGDTIRLSGNHSVPNDIYTYTNYHVSILTDGTIAVFRCRSLVCEAFDVSLLQENPFNLKSVYSNTNTSRSTRLANMVSVEGYVYITFGEDLTSDMSLHVLSIVDDMVWKQRGFLKFNESVQMTFTQSNPANNNVLMLTVAVSLVCVCLLAATLALLFLKCSKQNEDTTATNTGFVVSCGLNRGSMWSEMPRASQSGPSTNTGFVVSSDHKRGSMLAEMPTASQSVATEE